MPDDAPSARTRELIATGARLALQSVDTWVAAVSTATLSTVTATAIAADPDLREALRRGNADNLLAWATANIRAPGEPVPANASAVQLGVARDLVRRGLFGVALDAYRSGQDAAWARWMDTCFALTRDPDELRELLTVSAASIANFVGATIDELARHIEDERDQLTRGSQSERRDLVSLILSGTPVARIRAETTLGYRLDQSHVAAIIWSSAPDLALDAVEDAAELMMRAVGTRYRLTVIAAGTTLWIWLPTDEPPNRAALDAALADTTGIRLTLGRPGRGPQGFRRSHQQATEARGFVDRIASADRVTVYADVAVAALAIRDPTSAAEFVADTLGDLAHGPPELHDTVRGYLDHLGNAAATAAALYTHRNTVLRRLARADELLPRPLAENPVDVAVALAILRWQPVSG